MPTKTKFRDSGYFWVLFWVVIVIIVLGVGGAIASNNKKEKERSDNIAFTVDEKYAQSLCARESHFPNIDWSQNEIISSHTIIGEHLTKDTYRLKSDETVPVSHYYWSSYSNIYGKNRSMNCYFVTDMNARQSKILWLYYQDLETGTGNIDAIGSEQELRELVK